MEETIEECTTEPLDDAKVEAFSRAIREQWFYQMYLDDLPVWGMVGEVLPEWDSVVAQEQFEKQLRHGETDITALQDAVQGKHLLEGAKLLPFVYTDRQLKISYNEDRIIQIDLTSYPDSLTKVEKGTKLTFKFEIEWVETTDTHHSRFERYLDHAYFKHQIHWFSIFNSFMMVIFLSSLVALLMIRTLKRDYAKYSVDTKKDVEDGEPMDEEMDLLGIEESGWKEVHGDVFRAPPYLPLFSALIGIGWQIATLVICVLTFAAAGPIHGDVYEERGEIVQAFLISYCLSSIIAGYSSGSYFKLYSTTSALTGSNKNTAITTGGQAWQGVLFLTIVTLPIIVISVVSTLHLISMFYGTISTFTFVALVKLFFVWIFFSIPLTVAGTLIGRHKYALKGKAASIFPCRVNSIPRPIPEDVAWYVRPKYMIPVAGLLPFGSIFIELYHILTSLWNYKYYHVYGFLLGMYIILAVVVSLTSIICIYFCLNSENYHWQWTSFFTGASTAAYVFLYGVFYFFVKTNMYGLLQTAFYFGYTFLCSLSFGILCGTLGHNAADKFVRIIFSNLKLD